LKPGGWIELQELLYGVRCDDGTMTDNYMLAKWLGLLKQGLHIFGVDLLGPSMYSTYLKDAGYVNIEKRVFKVPIGDWAKNQTLKTIGIYNRSMLLDGLQGLSIKPFTKGLGWSVEDVEVFLIDVRRSLMDRSIHSYLTFQMCYGQKPME
jgi:hypothetical protein